MPIELESSGPLPVGAVAAMQQAEFSHKAAPLTAYSTSVGDMVPGGVLLAAAPTKIAASVDPSATSKHSPVFSHSHDFSQPSTIAGSHMNRQLFDERPEWKSEAFPLIPLAPVTSVYTKKVCDAFLDKYYSILYTTPDKAFQFYQDSSRLSRPEQKGVPNSVTTLQGIYEKILSFHSDSMIAEVELVDIQELYDGEISIHVTGCLSRYDYSERKITQSFLLAPQVGGYFILQDVIRYVDEHDPPEATSVPAIPPITADSDTEVELQSEEGIKNNDESLFLFTAPLSAKSAKMFSLNLKLSLEEDKGEERGSLDTPLDSEDGAAGSKSNIERAVRVFSKKVSGLSQKVGCNNKPENTAKFPLFRRREYIFVISVDSHPAQDLLGQLTRIFEIARSDKVPCSVGFIPSTALINSAVHSLIVFGGMSVTKFDAFICNNGSDFYYPSLNSEDVLDGSLLSFVIDLDYHSQINYLCCGGGFRKTLGRWAASTVRKKNGSEEQVVNTDEQCSTNFCYAFNMKIPSVPPVQEPRKMLRIQALRCHVIYNWNGTRLHFIPVLASKSPALRNVYAGWGVARRGVIDIAAEATKLEQPMVLDLTTYGINGVVGVFPQSEIQYEVPGMVLSDFRGIARKNMGAAVVDCGIDILVYFTDLQRRAVVSTATITCLHPLRLIHVTTATVLAYGIYKTDLPENVAFVSVDHASTQVCIAGLKKVQLKIPAHAFDWSLGGRDCDEVMFKYFASKFKEKSKIDVYQTAGACIWLWVACEKLQKATTECFVPMAGLLFQIGFQKAGHSSMVPRDMGCYVTIAIGKWGMVSRLLQLLIDLGLPLKRACGWIVVRYNAHAFGAMYVADFLSCTTDDNIEVLFHVSVQGGIIWPP